MSSFFPVLFKRAASSNFQQYRHLPRWSSRRPVRVIEPEEYNADKDTVKIDNAVKPAVKEVETRQRFSQKYPKINWRNPRNNLTKVNTDKNENGKKFPIIKPLTIIRNQPKSSKKVTTDMLETVIDAEGNYIYTKMANNDPRVCKILTDVKTKKEKEKNDLVVLEGKRLIKDALNGNCKLEYILFSRKTDVDDLTPYLPKTGSKLYKMPYSEIQMWSDLTTSPGIMGVFKIPDTESYVSKHSIPLTVICDNVREPSNLGAILRTCSAVGCERVLLTKGCVNVWDSKVLRSASGAHFKLQIYRKLTWEKIREVIPKDSNIYIADNSIVTSDASTNVEKTDQDNIEISLSEVISSLPLVPYFGVTFNCSSETVLIMGGETEGISEDSYRLAYQLDGARLNVPLSNNVDSLNTGTALGVIAFEIKRQLILSGELYKKNVRNTSS